MDYQKKAAIILNDMDSMMHRIEELPAHEDMTLALQHVGEAAQALSRARAILHQRDMADRHDE